MDKTANETMEQAALRYVAAARVEQQLISETLTQVAGFALLLMTSRRRAALAEGALAGARDASARAVEAVRALTVPGAAAHHHHHLCGAADMLAQACAAASGGSRIDAAGDSHDTLVRALRASSDHLRATSRLLPGFELVDFGQACCAAHAPRRLLEQTT